MQRIIIHLLCLLLSTGCTISKLDAQQIIGSWKSHLSFSEAVKLSDTGERIYCATKSGLFYYHKNDHTVQVLTKVEGLSDMDVSGIAFESDRDILVVAYRNANIDLISGSEVFNIADIKRKQLTGNKTIHNIDLIGDFAYISCGFGIVVLNLDKMEIRDTYFIGENGSQSNVYDMASDGNWLYAATENGLYKADINHPNLIDYNNWSRINELPNPELSCNGVTWFAGRLFASIRSPSGNLDSLYVLESGIWSSFQTTETSRIYHLGVSADKLVVVNQHNVTLYDANLNVIRNQYLLYPNHALHQPDGILWIADRGAGMIYSPEPWIKDTICPDGPHSNEVLSIDIMDDRIYTVAGGVTPSWNNIFNQAELNYLRDGQWASSLSAEYRDLIQVSIHPGNRDHVFAASWGYGLVEYLDGEIVNVYREGNSSLQSIIPGDDFFRLGGSVFDRANNLWVTNTAVAEPISVRRNDGEWISYKLDGKLKVSTLGEMINTVNDHKWILCPRGQGLFTMDVNGTLEDISDDSYVKFDVVDQNGKVISNYVYSFAEDRDGNIWVGTDEGIVVYYNPSRVFSGELFYGQQIIVPRNDGTGLADILLENERVTAIAIDGANRKWIGTSQAGAFLLSEDGLDEIHHFTRENSPLLSNNIMDIAINANSGVVYIATDLGLISYKGSAIEGKEDFSEVYVYPNPVREDYRGEIVITGLVADVNVKITDVTGNLVYETTSLGGQAIWDGRNFSGERVQTGVYMVFCTNTEGTLTHTTKLLVIH